jgi:hypothetical protein
VRHNEIYYGILGGSPLARPEAPWDMV